MSFASWISLEDLLGLLASLCWNFTSFFGFVMVCGKSQYSDWETMDGSLRQLERDLQQDGWAGRGETERGWKDRVAWTREGERTAPDDQTNTQQKEMDVRVVCEQKGWQGRAGKREAGTTELELGQDEKFQMPSAGLGGM